MDYAVLPQTQNMCTSTQQYKTNKLAATYVSTQQCKANNLLLYTASMNEPTDMYDVCCT